MTRIIMCGCNGAMGRMITGIVNEDAEAEIVAGIDMVDTKENSYPVFQKLADCDVEADALIDFSTPKILDDILTFSKEKKVPVVLCTTGYDDEQLAKIEEAGIDYEALLAQAEVLKQKAAEKTEKENEMKRAEAIKEQEDMIR